MITCPECGKEISDKAKKCVHCGKILKEDEVPQRFCSECGKAVSLEAQECPSCGCPIEAKEFEKRNYIEN